MKKECMYREMKEAVERIKKPVEEIRKEIRSHERETIRAAILHKTIMDLVVKSKVTFVTAYGMLEDVKMDIRDISRRNVLATLLEGLEGSKGIPKEEE